MRDKAWIIVTAGSGPDKKSTHRLSGLGSRTFCPFGKMTLPSYSPDVTAPYPLE